MQNPSAQEHPLKLHRKSPLNNELTTYKDLVINYLIRSNAQVAHTLMHTASTRQVLEGFHAAGRARAKRKKSTAYSRSEIEDSSPAGVLMISAATAGYQGVDFAEWLAWAVMLAKSGLNMPEQQPPPKRGKYLKNPRRD